MLSNRMTDVLQPFNRFLLEGPEEPVENAFVGRLLRVVEATAKDHAVHPLEESRLVTLGFASRDLPFVLGKAVPPRLGDIQYLADKAFAA